VSEANRVQFIDGLRNLADSLERDATLPVPSSTIIAAFVDAPKERLEEIAQAHGASVASDEAGMSEVEVRFGPIFYIPWGVAR
jgi:hypothetical protein